MARTSSVVRHDRVTEKDDDDDDDIEEKSFTRLVSEAWGSFFFGESSSSLSQHQSF